MRSNMKTVLVLPGSYWQIELVKKIKEQGHRVLVVNPFPDSPCFPYADGHLQEDIFAEEHVLEYARQNNVDAVLSDECDIAMPLVARLGEKLHVTAISREMAELYTNKFQMREFCAQHGLRSPEYCLCKDAQDAAAFFRALGRPMIIKPLDSNASHGVFVIRTEEDIYQHFEESMSFSRWSKVVLAERYVEGTEFTIDGIKTPNGHFTLAISEKKHFKHNQNIANELLFSHKSDEFDYEKLKKTNDAFVTQSDLRFGFTHAEYKYEDGEFYLIEIAARGGGNMISSVITQYLSGHDTYQYLIDCALGDVQERDFSIDENHRERAAVLKFFQTPHGGGRVKAIHGEELLRSNPDIKEYMLYFGEGDEIQDCVSDSARIGFYIACCENMAKLKETMEAVERTFVIEME